MNRPGATSAVSAVRAAMAATPRGNFLPAEQVGLAGIDGPLPIGAGQTSSQPSTVFDMLVALRVRKGQRVLDVGAGSGWTTVLLARLTGPNGAVIGVERIPELAAWGAGNVASATLPWATLLPADPTVIGRPQDGPYQRILVSAEAQRVPADLVHQLDRHGVLVIPVDGHLLRVRPGHRDVDLGRYRFVPLVTDG